MTKTKRPDSPPMPAPRARAMPTFAPIPEESRDIGTQTEYAYFRRGAVDGEEHALFKSPVHDVPTYYAWQRPDTPPTPTREYVSQIRQHHEYMTSDMRRSPCLPDLKGLQK
jgi:hypothetical protein